MTVMPEYAWQRLAIDFFDATSWNTHLLVVVDYHSRYLSVKIMNKNKTAEEVINKLQELFATFDYPVSMKSDNGPPFNSVTFQTTQWFENQKNDLNSITQEGFKKN